MRKSVMFIVLIVAGMTFNPGISAAVKITPAAAKAACKGKPSTGHGGCNWCCKKTCTMVSCDKEGRCEQVTVSVGKNKE